jgi:thiosulfate reductase cytochrome b subunit
MKKVYLYKRFERFWHWTQTLLILALIITGFEIHGSTSFIGYETSVKVHNYAAWALLVLIVFAIFWHLTTDEWRNYMPTMKNLKAQIEFYLTGIFRNAPHPVKKKLMSKLNPLQRLAYFGLKVIILPVIVVSGVLYMYFHYPVPGTELESLESVAVIHTMAAYLLVAFVLLHLYLITTGRTVTSNLKAMVTGWEVMDDEEVEEIMQDAMKEAELKIKPLKGYPDKKIKVEELKIAKPEEIPVNNKKTEKIVTKEDK